MSRTVELQEDQLVINFDGLTSITALKRHLNIPYDSIKTVSVENFDIPLLQFRVGTSVADIREGRFLIDGKWCFVSYEHHENVIVFDLVEHEYAKVIVQLDNPAEILRLITQRV